MKKTPSKLEGLWFREFMADPTLFEKILSGEIPGNFICRGDGWVHFLTSFHVQKTHLGRLRKSKPENCRPVFRDLEILFSGVKETQQALSAYFGTTDFTITIHDGPLAGQEIPHVHVHVIPRLAGDGGGALPMMFPNSRPPNPPDFTGLSQLCQKIKEANQ